MILKKSRLVRYFTVDSHYTKKIQIPSENLIFAEQQIVHTLVITFEAFLHFYPCNSRIKINIKTF